VAVTRHQLGVATAAAGDRTVALAELATAVRIRSHRLGRRHPATVASRAALARV
jgi:hypothetical protein